VVLAEAIIGTMGLGIHSTKVISIKLVLTLLLVIMVAALTRDPRTVFTKDIKINLIIEVVDVAVDVGAASMEEATDTDEEATTSSTVPVATRSSKITARLDQTLSKMGSNKAMVSLAMLWQSSRGRTQEVPPRARAHRVS
jgi:hypothetical protein